MKIGRAANSRPARRSEIELGHDSSTAERTARTYLLIPGPDNELTNVAALVDRATATVPSRTDKVVPYLLFTRGLLYYRQGRVDAAIEAMKGEVSDKLLVAQKLVLAMALHQLGQTDEARRTIASTPSIETRRAPTIGSLGRAMFSAARLSR